MRFDHDYSIFRSIFPSCLVYRKRHTLQLKNSNRIFEISFRHLNQLDGQLYHCLQLEDTADIKEQVREQFRSCYQHVEQELAEWTSWKPNLLRRLFVRLFYTLFGWDQETAIENKLNMFNSWNDYPIITGCKDQTELFFDEQDLSQLDLKSFQKVKHIGIKHCVGLTKFLAQLPSSSLDTLTLYSCNLRQIDLTHLPQGLKHLELYSCAFSEGTLKNLPQKLKSLLIQGSRLSGGHLNNLPKYLETLSVRGYSLSPDGLYKLPKQLKRLIIQVGDLGQDALSHLPTGLKALECHCSDLSQVDPSQLPPGLERLTLELNIGEEQFVHRLPGGRKNLLIKRMTG